MATTPAAITLPLEGADIYRNLLKKCVSVRHAGKVVAYGTTVVATDVRFVVQAGKLARIRRLGQREICAYVRGTVTSLTDQQLLASDLPEGARRVCFNPYQHDAFVLEDGTPVVAADLFVMTSPCGSWVVNPR